MSRIPLKYHTNVLFYTKYTHPKLICRGRTDARTDGWTDGRTDGRTENIYSIFKDKLLLLGEHVLTSYVYHTITRSYYVPTAVHRVVEKNPMTPIARLVCAFLLPHFSLPAPPPASPQRQHTCGHPLGIGNGEFVRRAERCPLFRRCIVIVASLSSRDVQ